MKSLFSALGSTSTASPAAAAIRQSAHMTAHVSACWLDWVALDEAKKAACACFGVIVRDRARSCAIVLYCAQPQPECSHCRSCFGRDEG